MSITPALGSQISNLFSEKQEDSILTIQKTSRFSSTPSLTISVHEKKEIDKRTINEDLIRNTLIHFKELIGETRLKRICKRDYVKIDTNQLDNNTLILTKNVVRKIFIAMMDMQKEDVDELDGPIDEKLRKLFLFDNFKDFKAFLMTPIPKKSQLMIDRAKTSGKGFQGLIERICILARHHFKMIEERDNKSKELSDVEMLTSRFADREIPKKSVVHLSDGYFYVAQTFVKKGAYVYLLRDLEGIKPVKIVCRGTAMKRKSTGNLFSGINDLLIEIGTLGIKSIWPDLLQYLRDNNIQAVELSGKSLGGAFAQLLAILIEGLTDITVEKLRTYCSVGVGKSINDLFELEVLNRRETPFNIQIVRNSGALPSQVDYIPSVGGEHLGARSKRCKRAMYYMQPHEQTTFVFPEKAGFFRSMKRLFYSFSSTHNRQTTLKKFAVKKIDEKEIDDHLAMGNNLERVRKAFAYGIHISTLGLLNGYSFKTYFYSQKTLHSAKASPPKSFIPNLMEKRRRILEFLSLGFYAPKMH